jgi:glycogen(starch) synthase
MKILHCLYDHAKNPWVGGGGARRLGIIRQHLEDAGHTVDVVTGAFPGCDKLTGDDARCKFVGSASGYFASTFSYARAARKEVLQLAKNYDLVIEDFAPWNPLFIRSLKSVPKIIQLQSHLGREILRKYFIAGLPFYYLERNYPQKFAHRISISPQIGAYDSGTTKVIPNGIDALLLDVESPGGSYVGFMGRLDFNIKGIDTLLAAARISKLPIKIAGNGPDKEKLLREMEGLANVEWCGWLEGDAKLNFLKNAKFIVAPSRSEGQNMVVIESAALSKCCVVSAIDGLRYVVDGGFGLAFPAGSANDLASQMKTLWENDDARTRLEKSAREYVRNLTWPRLAGEFADFCEQVIAEHRRAHSRHT